MIGDPARLAEVLTEIAEWTLDDRRRLIASIEAAYGKAASQQLRDGLLKLWAERK